MGAAGLPQGKPGAPRRARTRPCAARAVSNRSVARGAEEPAGRGASLLFGLGAARALGRGLAQARRHQVLRLELLLDAERQKLARRLLRLKRADRALAARRELGEQPRIL